MGLGVRVVRKGGRGRRGSWEEILVGVGIWSVGLDRIVVLNIALDSQRQKGLYPVKHPGPLCKNLQGS